MKSVVYVDNDKINTELFVNAFTDYGHDVKAFENLDDAYDHVIQHNSNVVFIDIDYSNQKGINLARMIKNNELLVGTSVFLVGKGEANEFGWLAVDLGAEQYFSRPLNFEGLLPQVELFLKTNEDLQKVLISDDDSELEELLEIFLDANYENKIVIERTDSQEEGLSLKDLDSSLRDPTSEDRLLEVVENSAIGPSLKRLEGDYKKVRASRLKNPHLDGINIFVKLGKDHFVKVVDEKDTYNPEALNSYLGKGILTFYLDHESFSKLTLSILKGIKEKFSKVGLNESESVTLQFESISEIRKVVQELGIKPGVIDVADEVVKSVMSLSGKDKKLFQLLKNFFDKTDYVTSHAQFMNYVFAAIVSDIPGSHSTQETLNKFIRASMLCDIALKDDEIASIQSLESKQFQKLDNKKRNDIIHHMEVATDLFKDTRLISDDELNFIKNHHERPQGEGFPRGVNGQNLSLLTCFFITVYDFTDRLLKSPKKENINPIRVIEAMEDQYNEGAFKNTIAVLLKNFK